MKNIIWIFFPILLLTAWACHDEPENPIQPKLRILQKDSIALVNISKDFNTQSSSYPHPWNPADSSTWGENIRLDTIVDSETGESFLTVSALTLYMIEPATWETTPMSSWLTNLENVKSFKLFGCPGSYFKPDRIPIGATSVVRDKIDPTVPGYIHVQDKIWDTYYLMRREEWEFEELTVHGLEVDIINVACHYPTVFDLSNNLVSGEVPWIYQTYKCNVNLSHNKYTKLGAGWQLNEWNYVPNLQYNDIAIPKEWLKTDFWKAHHESFIGNPGYVAP